MSNGFENEISACTRQRWRRDVLLACLIGLGSSVVCLPAAAGVITFEVTPAGTPPNDNALLSEPYALTGGGSVRFFFDVNSNNAFDTGIDSLPAFEAEGNADPEDGFINGALGIADVAANGFAAQLGSFFLRQPIGLGGVPAPLIADYETTQHITELSGEIWDIDGAPGVTEQWRVDALGAADEVLASQLSPLGTESLGPYDAKPWVFAFTNLPSSFDKVRLTFVGSKTSGLGLAFNNFSPTVAAVPEPMTSAVFALGLVSIGIATTWRRASGRNNRTLFRTSVA